jgi:hypothetical protein
MLTAAGCADNGDEGEEVNEVDEDNYGDVEEGLKVTTLKMGRKRRD